MHTTSECYGSIRMPQWLWDADITMGAKNVYSLMVIASRGQDHAWPSQEWLAGKLRVSIRSVQRYINELVGFNLLAASRERIQGRLRNVYWFLDHEMIPKKQPKKFAQRHDNPPAILSHQEDNREKGIKSPLPPHEILSAESVSTGSESEKNSNCEKTPMEAATVAATAEITQEPAWLEAKASICEAHPHFRPLLNQLIGRQLADGTLFLAGPNTVITGIIERQHGQRIAEGLRQTGIVSHRFGVQSGDLRRQVEAQEQAMEAREQINTAMQARDEKLTREQNMARMTPAQQFDLLVHEYPCQKGIWWAWQTFSKMRRRNELPNLPFLLTAIRQHKADPSWQRDCGRWVPHLSNWLARHCWEDA